MALVGTHGIIRFPDRKKNIVPKFEHRTRHYPDRPLSEFRHERFFFPYRNTQNAISIAREPTVGTKSYCGLWSVYKFNLMLKLPEFILVKFTFK